MSCCWGFHASSPSEELRFSHPICSGRPGTKKHHNFQRCWNEIPSMCGPSLCLHNEYLSPPPLPAPPPPPAAVWGDGCLQALDPTGCPCIQPPGWVSSRNPTWLPEQLWWRNNFYSYIIVFSYTFAQEHNWKDPELGAEGFQWWSPPNVSYYICQI